MKTEILPKNENDSIQKEIISKIRDYINFKNLEPGDKYPLKESFPKNLKLVGAM